MPRQNSAVLQPDAPVHTTSQDFYVDEDVQNENFFDYLSTTMFISFVSPFDSNVSRRQRIIISGTTEEEITPRMSELCRIEDLSESDCDELITASVAIRKRHLEIIYALAQKVGDKRHRGGDRSSFVLVDCHPDRISDSVHQFVANRIALLYLHPEETAMRQQIWMRFARCYCAWLGDNRAAAGAAADDAADNDDDDEEDDSAEPAATSTVVPLPFQPGRRCNNADVRFKFILRDDSTIHRERQVHIINFYANFLPRKLIADAFCALRNVKAQACQGFLMAVTNQHRDAGNCNSSTRQHNVCGAKQVSNMEVTADTTAVRGATVASLVAILKAWRRPAGFGSRAAQRSIAANADFS